MRNNKEKKIITLFTELVGEVWMNDNSGST